MSPSPHHIYDLEIHLRSMGEGRYSADMLLNDPTSVVAPLNLAEAVLVTFDYEELRTDTNDKNLARYGAKLSTMLFADKQMHNGWIRGINFAEGRRAALRLRLRLDGSDALLHALHWETLQDLQSARFLAMDERILLSRDLPSNTLASVVRCSPGTMRALVFIASPNNLAECRLNLVDVVGESKRALTALHGLQTHVIASNGEGQRATLPALIDAIRDGYDIIYIVAHGQIDKGKPALCLENEHGNVAWATGAIITDALSQIIRCPTLVILAACETAGNDYEAPLSALGPELVRAGVPAVLAMQGNVSMIAVERMMPIFLRELQREGLIDRALATARQRGRDLDWWRFVFYTRLRDGRIWDGDGQKLVLAIQPYCIERTQCNDVIDIIEGIQPNQEHLLLIYEAIRRSNPFLPSPSTQLTWVWQFIDYFARQNRQAGKVFPYPLLEFVERLATYQSANNQRKLREWTDRVARDLQAECKGVADNVADLRTILRDSPAMAPIQQPSLLIDVIPDISDPTRFSVGLWLWE